MRFARFPGAFALAPLALLLLSTPAKAELFAAGGYNDFFRIDEATATATKIADAPGYFQAMGDMATHPSGSVYIVRSAFAPDQIELDTVDPATGAVLTFGPALAFYPAYPDALAFSPDGTLYAAQGGKIYTVDLESGATTLVGDAGLPRLSWITGLAFSADGTFYGWDSGSGGSSGLALLTIDPLTGVATDVDPTVQAPVLPSGDISVNTIAFGPDGTLYAACQDLYTVDLATGALTLIGPLPNVPSGRPITGMVWIPEPSTLTALLTLATSALVAHLYRRRRRLD